MGISLLRVVEGIHAAVAVVGEIGTVCWAGSWPILNLRNPAHCIVSVRTYDAVSIGCPHDFPEWVVADSAVQSRGISRSRLGTCYRRSLTYGVERVRVCDPSGISLDIVGIAAGIP
jgi:hypothetical protein